MREDGLVSARNLRDSRYQVCSSFVTSRDTHCPLRTAPGHELIMVTKKHPCEGVQPPDLLRSPTLVTVLRAVGGVTRLVE
jgi:hypothetical protein